MKYLLSFALLLLTLNLSANSDLWALVKIQQCNLAYGVTLPEHPDLTDFTKPYASTPVAKFSSFEHMLPVDETLSYWYYCDFAEDPFDGRIEIMTMGEPSASTTSTLLISCILGLMVYIRKRSASLAQ